MLYKCTNEDVLKKQNQCAMFFKDYGNRSIFIFLAVAHEKFVEWKQQQKRFPFPLWGSICKEHYVMNWKLSYNVFVCRKETLIYTKKKEERSSTTDQGGEEGGGERERSEYIEKLKALWIERKHPFYFLHSNIISPFQGTFWYPNKLTKLP